METAALLIQWSVVMVVLLVFVLAPIREWEFATIALNIVLGMAWIATIGTSEKAHVIVAITGTFFGYMLYSWIWLMGIHDGYFSDWVEKRKAEHWR